jgi:transcriptional regulator with XRE-family HTH domain
VEYKTIGQNMKKQRKAMGLKQEEFAELAGLSTSYYGAIERGKKLPSLETFIHLANTFNVSSDTLLLELLNVRNQLVMSELSKQLSHLPSSEQRRILNVMETMIADSIQGQP